MAIDNFQAANIAIMNVFVGETSASSLTTFQVEKLTEIVASVIPPEKVAHFAEFAYANRDDLQPDTLTAAADVCTFATANSFYGLGQDQRGFKMASVLRGNTVTDAPAPDSRWVETPAAPAAGDPMNP